MDLGGGLGTETLLSEILKRLPVKSLVRFRSVSKPWDHLINDPFFVTYHLQFNKSSSPSSSVLGITSRRDHREEEHRKKQKFEYFRIDHTHKTTLEHLKIPLLWRLKPDSSTHWSRISIRAHCNGLTLAFDSQTYLVYDDCRAKRKPFHVDRYIICNPIARRFLILPESTIEPPNLYSDEEIRDGFKYPKVNATGLGFIDDVVYKVVRVTYGMGDGIHIRNRDFKPYEPPWVDAYDSGSCCWRRVPMNSEFSYKELNDGVYNSFDGCLYWFGRGYGNRARYSTLVSFHLVDETWHETLFPYKSRDDEHEHHEDNGVFGGYGVCESVHILGESVVMLVGDLRNRLLSNVWKMNKGDDNKLSWAYMYTFNFGGSPLGFIGDGELLLKPRWGEYLFTRKKLVLHDSKKMNDACFGFMDLDFEVGNIVTRFVESLVLLDGETVVIEDVSEEPSESFSNEDEDLGDLSSMFDDNL